MQVAFGFKAHSGWAALVVLGLPGGEPVLVERSRLELVAEAWQKQPYHAAERQERRAARETVRRGVEAAHRMSARAITAAVAREQARGNRVTVCAVLSGAPMPAWSIDEILDVHFRMHKVEGVLFRDALASAAEACGLRVLAVPEKSVVEYAGRALGRSAARLTGTLAALGKTAGAPWGKDQKDAALAALAALQGVFT